VLNSPFLNIVAGKNLLLKEKYSLSVRKILHVEKYFILIHWENLLLKEKIISFKRTHG
jgi:hypothetical protein